MNDMNRKKKEDKNKDLDKEKINFLGEWNVLNPDPPVVKPDEEKKGKKK